MHQTRHNRNRPRTRSRHQTSNQQSACELAGGRWGGILGGRASHAAAAAMWGANEVGKTGRRWSLGGGQGCPPRPDAARRGRGRRRAGPSYSTVCYSSGARARALVRLAVESRTLVELRGSVCPSFRMYSSVSKLSYSNRSQLIFRVQYLIRNDKHALGTSREPYARLPCDQVTYIFRGRMRRGPPRKGHFARFVTHRSRSN